MHTHLQRSFILTHPFRCRAPHILTPKHKSSGIRLHACTASCTARTLPTWQHPHVLQGATARGNFFLEITGLRPGLYYYKYIVDGTWAVDPTAPKVKRCVVSRSLGGEMAGSAHSRCGCLQNAPTSGADIHRAAQIAPVRHGLAFSGRKTCLGAVWLDIACKFVVFLWHGSYSKMRVLPLFPTRCWTPVATGTTCWRCTSGHPL